MAQITINLQIPPGGIVPKDQLWNLILSNNSQETIQASIKMNLQNALSGEILLSGNTGHFTIGKGIKVLTVRDIQPVIYNTAEKEFQKNYLPMGSYIVCYQIYYNGQKGEEIIGEECTKLNIDPLSPPLLNTPSDRSTIDNPYPQFSWTPPTSVELFSNLNYEIIVTEILEGQSGAEAVQYNSPIYWRDNIRQTFESYPSTYKALEKNKTYAWQIVAKNEQQYAIKTDVWTFNLNQSSNNFLLKGNEYVLLENSIKGIYNIAKDTLRVKYFSYDAPYETVIFISDEKGNIIRSSKKKVKQGDNYFELDIKRGFAEKKIYKVRINTALGKQQSLTFRISKS